MNTKLRNLWYVVIPVMGMASLAAGPSLVSAGGATQVYVMDNPATGDHFYTTSSQEQIANSCPNPSNYRSDQAAHTFYGFIGQTSSPAVPVYRLVNSVTSQHFYTTNADEGDGMIQSGYRFDSIEFYSHVSQQSGDIAMYRMYSPKTGNHFFTTDQNERITSGSTLGYTDEGFAFWVATTATTSPPDPTIGLSRMFNSVNNDHFFASDEERDAISCSHPAYTLEPSTFDEFTSKITATNYPVTRYYNPSTKIHLYTASTSEGTAAVSAGYTNEGTAFYADSANTANIYRLRRPSGGYYFTEDSSVVSKGKLNDYLYEETAFTSY